MNRKPGRKIQFYIFLFFFFLALIFLGKFYFFSIDGFLRLAFTEAITKLPEPVTFTKFSPLESILAVPFYSFGDFLTQKFNLELESTVLESVKYLIFLFFSLTCLYVFKFLNKLGLNLKKAFVFSLLFALTSLLLPYNSTFFSETITASLLLIACYYLFLAVDVKENKKKNIIFSLTFLFFASLNSYFAILFFIPAILTVFVADYQKTKSIFLNLKKYIISDAFVYCFLFSVLSLGCLFLYNYLRYGNILTFGYGGEVEPANVLFVNVGNFSNNIFIGLYGLLFSAGKSIFLFNPFLIIFFITYKKFFQEKKKFFWLILSYFLIILLISAKWWSWYGGLCWGPRFLIPTIPLLYIIIGYSFFDYFKKNIWHKFIIVIISLVSFLVQLLGIIIDPFKDLFVSLRGNAFFEPLTWFTPQHSPIFSHWQYLSFKDFGLLFFSRDNLALLSILILLLATCLVRILFLIKDEKLRAENINVINI